MNKRFFEFVEGDRKEEKKGLSAVDIVNQWLDEHDEHIRQVVDFRIVYDNKGKQHIIIEAEIV